MLTMCWFYCIPFAKGLFFAASLMLIVFALFVLKRGVRQSRPALRQTAFLLIFLSLLKMLTIDIYLLREVVLCDTAFFQAGCSPIGFRILQFSGLLVLALSSVLLLNVYRSFMRNRKQAETKPQAGMRVWANISISLVAGLIVWLVAPWAGYLTVGHVPQLFMQVPWQNLALLNITVLLISFWKLEDCNWIYNPTGHAQKKQPIRVWTPKDTLWLAAILFLITLLFSYVSHDVLSPSAQVEKGASHLRVEDLDFTNIGPQFGGLPRQ